MTTFSGKQIVITTKEGEEFRFMGSAYNLRVDENIGHGTVWVIAGTVTVSWWYFSELDSIVEDQFGLMYL